MKKAGNVAVEISLLTRVKKGTHRVAIPVELLTLFNYRCSKKKSSKADRLIFATLRCERSKKHIKRSKVFNFNQVVVITA